MGWTMAEAANVSASRTSRYPHSREEVPGDRIFAVQLLIGR